MPRRPPRMTAGTVLAVLCAATVPAVHAVPAARRMDEGLPQPNCQVAASAPPPLTEAQQFSRGPEYGTLIVAGGSLSTNSTVFQRMLLEAGGAEQAAILFVPTNGGGNYETPAQREASLNSFLSTSLWTPDVMATPVRLIHTYDRAVADSAEFTSVIDSANAVYFAGGLPYHCYDAYFGTNTQSALDRLLRRGGVIGGSSAGALMQSNLMLRGDRSGRNSVMLGDPREGFAFGGMQNIVFDVHYLMRNRLWDLIEVVELYPQMLGMSIDEDTAVVMKGDELEVVGAGWVAVYDTTLWQPESEVPYCANFLLYAPRVPRCLLANHGKFFFMTGNRNTPDRFNVRTREVNANTDFDDASVEDGARNTTSYLV